MACQHGLKQLGGVTYASEPLRKLRELLLDIQRRDRKCLLRRTKSPHQVSHQRSSSHFCSERPGINWPLARMCREKANPIERLLENPGGEPCRYLVVLSPRRAR